MNLLLPPFYKISSWKSMIAYSAKTEHSLRMSGALFR